MGVVLMQILQWILRIILFLLLLIVVLLIIVLIVPIRYQVEGEFLEKKPGGRGKITWFFYLIYMTFVYEEDFRIQVRVFGFKVFDSAKGLPRKTKHKKQSEETTREVVPDASEKVQEGQVLEVDKNEEADLKKERESSDGLAAWEKKIEAESEEEAEFARRIEAEFSQQSSPNGVNVLGQSEQNVSYNMEQSSETLQNEEDNISEKEKKTLSEKIGSIKLKIQEIIQKIKDIIAKIQEGKLKVKHYLELWNRKETQITFSRAKKKFGGMIKAILPRKWKIVGEVGFDNPATTGQVMGVLGAMYPILGNKVQIMPNFENAVMNIEGNVKGHIRLGNLLYQLVSLILNRHCFKFIKLLLDELSSMKKS